jgi:hypothetical protein
VRRHLQGNYSSSFLVFLATAAASSVAMMILETLLRLLMLASQADPYKVTARAPRRS